MDILTAKWVVLASLFLLTFIFSLMPMKLVSSLRHSIDPTRRARISQIISLLSCFAGGVFMAAGLLDLFPEVTSTLEKAMIDINTSFPVAEFTVSIGFFLVLILEQIVLNCKEQELLLIPNHHDALTSHEVGLEEERQRLRRQGSIEGISENPLLSSTELGATEEIHAHSTFRSLLLLIALSMHSLFEGLAIGLQPSVTNVMQIFVPVIIHKIVIAFSLGLNLVQSQLSLGSILRSNLLFSITSPIGIGIAIGLEEFGKSVDSSIVNGVLQGLACGTFLYITFFEVLPHELNHGGNRLLKLLMILFGFTVVSGVLFLEPAVEVKPPSKYLNILYLRT